MFISSDRPKTLAIRDRDDNVQNNILEKEKTNEKIIGVPQGRVLEP